MTPRRSARCLIALTTLFLLQPGSLLADEVGGSLDPQSIPEAKRTTLGLYLTAAEAYERWKTDPEGVKILDVRTMEEYVFVGHAPMAWNIPFALQTHEWDPERQHFSMQPNPDFVSEVSSLARPEDTIFVVCRSGGRSAKAVNALAKAGFTRAYTIVDGMEGDTVKDPGSVFHGKRMRNGWKNEGLPWTYELEWEHMLIPGADAPAAH